MPWNQESPMDQRVKLVSDWLGGSYTKSQLSQRYGVSRPTTHGRAKKKTAQKD